MCGRVLGKILVSMEGGNSDPRVPPDEARDEQGTLRQIEEMLKQIVSGRSEVRYKTGSFLGVLSGF